MASPAASAAATRPILRREDGELRLYFEDDFLQSRMCEADPARLVLEYTRYMMGFLLFVPRPQRVAMIGLGGGSLAKYCHAHLPETDFTAVDVSPEVIAWRTTFAIPADGPRFRVVCANGADWVRQRGTALDALLVDGFDVDGLPPELCSAAFYDACRVRLADGGVLVANLHPDEEDYARCVERLHDAFDGRVVEVTADESDNRIVFAGSGPAFPPTLDQLAERLHALAAHHDLPLATLADRILDDLEHRRRRRRRRRCRIG